MVIVALDLLLLRESYDKRDFRSWFEMIDSSGRTGVKLARYRLGRMQMSADGRASTSESLGGRIDAC